MSTKVKTGLTRFKSIVASLFMVSLVFSSTSYNFIKSAYAVAGQGTATINIGTGGTNASNAVYGGAGASGTVVVGTKSYVRLNLTVGASGIAANQNNVTVQINTNLFPTNGWSTTKEAALTDLNTAGEWFVSYTDTDSGTTNNAAISFASSTAVNTGLITIQANQQMDATDIISIFGVVQDNHYMLAAAPVDIKTDDTGANNLTSLAANPTIATTYADANSTFTLGANSVVGAVGNSTLTVNVPFALDAGDTVGMTFGDAVNIGGVASAVTGTFENGGEITCNDISLITIICTVISGPTATTGTIIMTGITTLYTISDGVDVGVEDEGVGANYISVDLNVPVTPITAADAAGTITLADPSIGGVGNTTLNLTLPFALDANDTIDITFPAHIDVSNVGGPVTGTLEGGANITCADLGQVVTCTTDGATNNSGTIILTGITAAGAGTDNASLEVENEGIGAQDIATDSTVALTDTPSGSLTNTSLSLSNSAVSAPVSVTIGMTLEHDLPEDGKIKITFNGFDLTGANTVTNHSGIDGTFTVSDAGDVVTIERNGDGTQVLAGTPILLKFSSVVTPASPQTTAPFQFQTTTSADLVQDEDTNVPGVQITSGGGSGGGGVDNPNNQQTNDTPEEVDVIIQDQVVNGPVQINENNVVDNGNDTITVKITEDATLTLKPTEAATIWMMIPKFTSVTTKSSWDRKINPPLIKDGSEIEVSGEKIEGSTDLLKRADVFTLVKMESNVPLHFNNALTLSIPVDLPEGTKVKVYSSETANNDWMLYKTLEVKDKAVTVTTDHPSVFALVKEGTTPIIAPPTDTFISPFTDIKGHWAEAYINQLAEAKIVSGKTATIFDPNAKITRCELTKIAVNAFGVKVNPIVTVKPFDDIAITDWCAPYAAAAKEAGLVKGVGNNRFEPLRSINRAEAVTIFVRGGNFGAPTKPSMFKDVTNQWFANDIRVATELGIVSGYGDGTFGPGNDMTRAEASKVTVLTIKNI